MSVREEQLRHADDADGVYGVVEKPDIALIIPAEEERFHLITQFRYRTEERSLEFPQGTAGAEPLEAEALAQVELIGELGYETAIFVTSELSARHRAR